MRNVEKNKCVVYGSYPLIAPFIHDMGSDINITYWFWYTTLSAKGKFILKNWSCDLSVLVYHPMYKGGDVF